MHAPEVSSGSEQVMQAEDSPVSHSYHSRGGGGRVAESSKGAHVSKNRHLQVSNCHFFFRCWSLCGFHSREMNKH